MNPRCRVGEVRSGARVSAMTSASESEVMGVRRVPWLRGRKVEIAMQRGLSAMTSPEVMMHLGSRGDGEVMDHDLIQGAGARTVRKAKNSKRVAMTSRSWFEVMAGHGGHSVEHDLMTSAL